MEIKPLPKTSKAVAASLSILLGLVAPAAPAFAAFGEIKVQDIGVEAARLPIGESTTISEIAAPANVHDIGAAADAISSLPAAAAVTRPSVPSVKPKTAAAQPATGARTALHGLADGIAGANRGGTPGASAAAVISQAYGESSLPLVQEGNLPPIPESAWKRDSVTTYPSVKTLPFNALLKVIADPQEGFLSKIMIARNARRTLDVNTYILTPSPVGYAYLHELKVAYERGVSVRLLVDALGSPDFKHFTHPYLKAVLGAKPGIGLDGKEATIEVVMFNSLFNPELIFESFHRIIDNLRTLKDHASLAVRGLERGHLPSVSETISKAAANLQALKSHLNPFIPNFRKDRLGHIFRWRDRRSHDKNWAADLDDPEHAVAVLGGRNLDDNYYGVPEVTPKTYHDMEIIVRNNTAAPDSGSLKTTLLAHYNRLFDHLGNKALKANGSAKTQSEQEAAMKSGLDATLNDNESVSQKFQEMLASDYLRTGFSEVSAHFVNEIENITRHHAFVDPQGRLLNRPNGDSLMGNITERVGKAKKSLLFVSPYLIMNPKEIAWLKAWLDADPERTLTIQSNSIATGDDMPAQALVDTVMPKGFYDDPNWQRSGRSRVKLLHFRGPGKIHAKFAIIDGELDGEWAAEVGSGNGDKRSRYLNSEHGMIFESKDNKPVEDLRKAAYALTSNSDEVGTPEWKAARAPHHFKLIQEWVYNKILFRLFPFMADMV